MKGPPTGGPGRCHRRGLRQACHSRASSPESVRQPAGRRDLRPGRLRDARGHGGTRPAPRRPRLRRVLLRSRTGAAGPVDGPDVPARRLLRNRLGYDREETRDSSQVGDRRRRTLRPGGRGEATLAFTGRIGLDSAVWRFGGDATEAVAKLTQCMKVSPDGHQMGQITVIGGANIDLPATLWNVDIRRASRTGPGYHDEAWERGEGYPPVFMRWTTKTNLELCMRLIAEGKAGRRRPHHPQDTFGEGRRGHRRHHRRPDEILGLVFR